MEFKSIESTQKALLTGKLYKMAAIDAANWLEEEKRRIVASGAIPKFYNGGENDSNERSEKRAE